MCNELMGLQGTEFSCSHCIGFIAFKWYYNRLHQRLTNLVLLLWCANIHSHGPAIQLETGQ